MLSGGPDDRYVRSNWKADYHHAWRDRHVQKCALLLECQREGVAKSDQNDKTLKPPKSFGSAHLTLAERTSGFGVREAAAVPWIVTNARVHTEAARQRTGYASEDGCHDGSTSSPRDCGLAAARSAVNSDLVINAPASSVSGTRCRLGRRRVPARAAGAP
jgi:hypothetical protein